MDLLKLKQQLDEAKKIATPRTLILWGREDLLGEAVESILRADKDWRDIKVLGNPDVSALAREVENFKPEIVIINRGPCEESFPPLLQIIENLPEVKIITVNPDNNLVEVYNKQKVRIEDISDLLAVIDKNSKSTIEGGQDQP
jgi:hypothetical protein